MHCRINGIIGGIDEAGRGPLAGPVVSSCVIWKDLPSERPYINDSKLLTERERIELFPWIARHAHKIGIGIATHTEIDTLNIHAASLLSMIRALNDTAISPDLVLVDGRHRLAGVPQSRSLVKGDRKCFFIASASIVAKVVRDHIMDFYAILFPAYNFRKNKGYPTKDHRNAVALHGPCAIHRRTFKGVREFA